MIPKKPIHRALVLCTGLLTALALAPESIEFRVLEGSSLTKNFKSSLTGYLDGFSLEVDGNDLGSLLGELEINSESVTEVSMTDTYHKLEEHLVTKLTRSFDELSNSTTVSFASQIGSESQEVGLASELEGKSVSFLWDPKTQQHQVSFEDKLDAEKRLLRALEFETDMRFLLPGGEVKEGESWSVPILAFKELIMPGGDLVWLPEEAPDVDMDAFGDLGEEIKERLEELLLKAVSGKASCTFIGIQKHEDVDMGVIEIKLDYDLDLDLIPIIEEFMETILDNLPMEIPLELDFETMNLALSFKSEGIVHWAMQAGHFSSLSMHSDMDFSVEMAIRAEMDAESHSAEMSMDLFMGMENEVQFSE